MPKLTDNQVALVRWIVAAHKAGDSAKVHTVSGRCWGANSHHHSTLKSLLTKGLVRHLQPQEPHQGWVNPVDGGYHPTTFEVELTSAGWDFLYRLDR